MKNAFLLATCLLLAPALCRAQEPAGQLPTAAKSKLDRTFPGWEFVKVRDEVRGFLRERVGAGARPEQVAGDFDGDGRQDFAVLITQGERVRLVALLKRGDSYDLHELGEPGEYLTLGRKGADGFDFHADKRFKYEHDAVNVWIFEKAGWAYVYEKGRFRHVYMVD